MKLFKRAPKQTPDGRRARQTDAKNDQNPVRRSSYNAASGDKAFMRNRTLTGIMSAEIGAGSEGSRAHLHKLHRQRRFMRGLIGVCFIIALGIGFLLSNRLTSTDIVVEGNGISFSQTDKQAFYASFDNYLSEHPTQLFMLSLQSKNFLEALALKHPEIQTASFRSELFGLKHTLVLSLRTPLLEWNVGSHKYYVDAAGTAFSKNYYKTPSVTVEDQSGVTFTDTASIPKRLISYIGQVTGALQTNAIGQVTRIVIPASSREVDVYLEGRDYFIKTHIDRDAYATAGDIQSALRYLDSKQIKPGYVDVRIEGKAFYK